MRTDHTRDLSRMRWFAYAALLAILVAFIAGRVTGRALGSTIGEAEATPTPRELPIGIERFHDAAAGVTCWQNSVIDNGGAVRGRVSLSCLPDQWLVSARSDDTP